MNITPSIQLKVAAGLALAVGVLSAAAAPQASAAPVTNCSLANGVLTVNMHGDTSIDIASSTILVHSGQPRACTGGLPTTTNTDALRIIDFTDDVHTADPRDGDTTLTVNKPAAYGPGRSPESNGLSEIEFVVNMNAGDDRLIAKSQIDTAAYWTAGTAGANWNNDGDPDLYGAFDHVSFVGSMHSDRISAHGGVGTGDPLRTPTVVMSSEEGDDELLGSDGDDEFRAGPGNDTVGGYDGNDFMQEEPGDDLFAGGPGVDTISFMGLRRGVTADLRGVSNVEGDGLNLITDFERAYGTESDDTLIGGPGSNQLNGYRGNDTLTSNGGADLLRGGEGDDTVSYATAPVAVNADLALGRVVVGAKADELDEVEHLIGSPFADTIVGSPQANRLVGGGGADTVTAGNGADRVDLRDAESDAFVSCGDDATTDVLIVDRAGVDPLNADCETIDVAPELPAAPQQPGGEPVLQGSGGGGGPTGGAGGSTGGKSQPGDTPDRSLAFTLGGAKTQRALKQGFIRVQVSCPQEPCSAALTAAASAGRSLVKTPRPARTTVSLASAAPRVVKLTLSRAQRRALAARRKPTLNVRAEAVDATGNRAVRTLRVRLTR